ncbi:AAA family ATPase [Crocosphaera subtropica]|nr:ATP-binding protein [Crocosphaera subtropica]
MLKTLTIENYRCFENFSINNLSKINLIVGQNNIGKTSLLEFINDLDNYNTLLLSTNDNYLENVEKIWDLIQLTPREDKVIEALQIINPDVEKIGLTISQYTKQIRLKIKGEDNPIPLSSMGEGMKKIFGLIIKAVILENGVLLIDEIERGLHYTAQTNMWRLLTKTAQELNVQIFATTHSWDCISAFIKALDNIEDKSFGKLFRLNNQSGKLRAVEYKSDEISIAVNQAIEVR